MTTLQKYSQMLTNVNKCPQMFTNFLNVNKCYQMLTNVNKCEHKCEHKCEQEWTNLSTNSYRWWQLLATVNNCLQILTNVNFRPNYFLFFSATKFCTTLFFFYKKLFYKKVSLIFAEKLRNFWGSNENL